jgi:diguanylate cyclase (GGDEF)-like protein
MPESLKPLWRLFIPALLLAIAFIQLVSISDYIVRYQPLSGKLPYILCAFACVIAHIYNRSRLLIIAIIVGGSYWLIQNHLQYSLDEPATYFRYTLLCILVPANLLLMMLMPEKGLWNKVSISLLVIPLAIGLSIHFYQPSEQLLLGLNQLLPLRPADGYTMSIGASVVFAAFVVSGLVVLWLKNGETEAAAIASILAVFITLAFFSKPLISTTLFSTAGLILIISLLMRSRELAFIDELSGLPGRRAFNEKLNNLGHTYSIAMIDIDHFKKFNDKYGHSVGDDVLKMVAALIGKNKGNGTAYRYGGEEFSIVYNGRNIEQCHQQLDILRQLIAEYLLVIRDDKVRKKTAHQQTPKRGASRTTAGVNVTISIGISERSDKYDTPEEVLQAADKALYKAKQAGRNRVCW